MNKIIISVIVILVIAGGTYWGKGYVASLISDDEQTTYRFTRIERRDMVNSVSATGTLSAVTTVEVGSEVSGQIKEVLVDFNSPVQKEQVIAIINPESYQTLVRQSEAELEIAEASLETKKTEILSYEAAVENAKASLIAAQAATKKAKVTLENAELNLNRQKSLIDQEFIAKNEYDSAKTTYESAMASLEQMKAQEDAAKTKITSAEVSLNIAIAKIKEYEAQVRLKQAALDKRNVDLENTVIRSPVDGIVIDRSIDVGQTVAASLQAPVLFTIAQDLHHMRVSTSVDEADIGRIKEGQAVQFTVDAYTSRKFKGEVAQIRKLGETVQNVVTYEVIVSSNNPDLSLMPGMTADVEIELLKKPDVLTVANAALRFKPAENQTANSFVPQASGANGFQSSAGQAMGSGGFGSNRPNTDQIIKRYEERLNLSEEQVDQMKTTFQNIQQKTREAFSNASSGGGPGGGVQQIRERIQKELKASISHILDSEQLELYEAMVLEQQASQGTLWRMTENGQLAMIPVRLGASGPSHTEIIGAGIEEGLQVIYSLK